MILLENVNVVIRDELLSQLKAPKASHCDIKCADYDGVEFFLWNDGSGDFNLALRSPAVKALLANGGNNVLKAVYGDNLCAKPTNQSYDVQLAFSVTGVPENNHDNFANKFAAFKSHLFAAPITERMQAATRKQPIQGLVDIPLRSSSERMFVKQDTHDKLTVIFSIDFSDADDVVFGRTFLQEFTKPVSGGATATYSEKIVPLELKGISNPPVSLSQAKFPVSFVTLSVYERHWNTPAKMQEAAFTLISFRNYVHYHIKCAKSYLHTRMRMKVEFLLKVLNRARHDAPKVQKTATGRSFVRK